MNQEIIGKYERNLALLQQGAGENRDNAFIAYGIIHVFCKQFDLAKQVFQECLLADGEYMAAVGTDREILMDAYEQYAFVDEDLWLGILADRKEFATDCPQALVERILHDYVPAFTQLLDEVKKR